MYLENVVTVLQSLKIHPDVKKSISRGNWPPSYGPSTQFFACTSRHKLFWPIAFEGRTKQEVSESILSLRCVGYFTYFFLEWLLNEKCINIRSRGHNSVFPPTKGGKYLNQGLLLFFSFWPQLILNSFPHSGPASIGGMENSLDPPRHIA